MGSCKRPNNRQKNMNRRAVFGRRRLLFFFLFALNSLFLSVYFFRSISDHSPPISPPEFHESPVSENQTDLTVPFSGKPWPVIPSFIPWSPTPNLSHKSCEAYFGNGFNHRVDLLRSPENSRNRADPAGKLPGGWFRCFYSETLESSICEGGRIRMNPAKIRMSDGGESLELVIGRREAEELPSFEPGAFEIELAAENRQNAGGKVASSEFLNRFVPQGVVRIHTMRALLDSIRVVESDKFYCSQWIEDPTLLVTRFEYANLFHTITDWYSAYVASRVTGLPSRPHLVFVDGHCKSPLEETWEALFSSLRYAKNFSSPVCFRHVILSPLGYETALFKGLTETINCQGAPASELRENTNMHKTSRLSEFGEMVGASFGLPLRVPKPVLTHNVLFVRREDYQAHPRHSGKVESRLSNEKEVFDSLKTWSGANHLRCTVNLVDGLFAHMSMKDQVRAIQEASVIIGAHGAGLTHIVAASPSAVVLEIISSQYRRPHFALISEWRGLEYHAINLPGSDADPAEVITKLSNIMESLGC